MNIGCCLFYRMVYYDYLLKISERATLYMLLLIRKVLRAKDRGYLSSDRQILDNTTQKTDYGYIYDFYATILLYPY